MINCQYCRFFLRSRLINFEEKIRKCMISKREVSALSEKCKSFTAVRYFYCFKYTQRVDIRVCVYRQNNSSNICDRCSQGELVNAIDIIRRSRPKIRRFGNKIRKIRRFDDI